MNDLDDRPLPPDEQRQEIEIDKAYTADWTAEPFAEPTTTPLVATTPTDRQVEDVTPREPITTPPAPPAIGASLWQRLLPLAIAGVVLFLDQFTKYLVETHLPLYQSWAPIPAIAPFFRLTHTTNTGAAFGLFQGGGWFFGVLAAVVAAAIIYYSLTLPRGQHLLRLALGLQLGGAVGNLLDRVQLGHVTDFLDFGPWPIFNLADTAVVSGVVLLAWMMLREERAARQANNHEPEPPVSPHLWREASNESSTRMNTD